MIASMRPVSVKPIWIGAAIGVAIGLFDAGLGVLVTGTLGFMAGYLIYANDRGRVEQRELNKRIGDLLERVSLLEYAVKRLRSGDAPVELEVPLAQPFDTSVAAQSPSVASAPTLA